MIIRSIRRTKKNKMKQMQQWIKRLSISQANSSQYKALIKKYKILFTKKNTRVKITHEINTHDAQPIKRKA
jgi:hypothetical protein